MMRMRSNHPTPSARHKSKAMNRSKRVTDILVIKQSIQCNGEGLCKLLRKRFPHPQAISFSSQQHSVCGHRKPTSPPAHQPTTNDWPIHLQSYETVHQPQNITRINTRGLANCILGTQLVDGNRRSASVLLTCVGVHANVNLGPESSGLHSFAITGRTCEAPMRRFQS